jgi:hypothetical protein
MWPESQHCQALVATITDQPSPLDVQSGMCRVVAVTRVLATSNRRGIGVRVRPTLSAVLRPAFLPRGERLSPASNPPPVADDPTRRGYLRAHIVGRAVEGPL